ncbi:MAG TPA: MauE/DoxX family redox-associated membrane protein [Planctomycetota bacterium]|nr:MauE/DoxX family redox-associated membrane protein [Planctomycetota bacterium]
MRNFRSTRIESLARAILGIAFVAAGALKVVDSLGFALSIARMQILPSGAIGPAAIVLPWIEIVAGVALLGRAPYRGAALGILSALLAAFTAALVVVLVRGRSTTCGCFGVEGGFLGRIEVALVRNLVLGAAAAFLATSYRRREPASPA